MTFAAPLKVIRLLDGYSKGWCVAGGWSIDFFIGHETRQHEDVEILVYRHEQRALQMHLIHWPLHKVITHSPGNASVIPWESDEWLALPIHQIRSYGTPTMPEFDLMLNEGTDADWIYRRNNAVTRSRSLAERHTPSGVPYLCPEIALLYKAHHRREKDQQDFDQVCEKLDSEARGWLIQSLEGCYPGHVWLERLQALSSRHVGL